MGRIVKNPPNKPCLPGESVTKLHNFAQLCTSNESKRACLNRKPKSILSNISGPEAKSGESIDVKRQKWLSISDPFITENKDTTEASTEPPPCAISKRDRVIKNLRIKNLRATKERAEDGVTEGHPPTTHSPQTAVADDSTSLPEDSTEQPPVPKPVNAKLKQVASTHRSNLAQKRKNKPKASAPVLPPDWWKTLPPDRTGRTPTVTFDPHSKMHPRQIEVLQRRAVDRERLKLVSKLGSEFMRIYQRYRFQKDSHYNAIDREYKYAQQAGTLCVLKGITPNDLIDYWDHHIGEFTDMAFPTMSFLSSPNNVDRAVSSLSTCRNGRFNEKSFQRANTNESMRHLGLSRAQLDPRLRRGLTDAGHDVRAYDDRSLLTIQSAAEAVARGIHMFISSKMKPMVDWAAANIFNSGTAEVEAEAR